ncbi:hypothetical protein GCM10027072_29250 [Streptomyces bullii]
MLPVVAGRPASKGAVGREAFHQHAQFAQGDLTAPVLPDRATRRVVVVEVRLDGLGILPEDV